MIIFIQKENFKKDLTEFGLLVKEPM